MKNLMIVFSLLFCFTSCEKEDPIVCGTDTNAGARICKAIHENNETALATLLNGLAWDLDPAPTTADPIGQVENLDILITRLDNSSCLEADLECYACLESFPPLSSVLVKATHNNETVEKRIYLTTSETETLMFRSMN